MLSPSLRIAALLALVLLSSAVFGRDLRQEAAVTALAFGPDGKTLASAGDDRMVRLWDIATGTVRHHLRGHEGTVSSLAYTRDGKTLASGGKDGGICLWEPATGKLLRRCPGHARNVLALSFSPDGRFLASGSYDRSVRVWDTAGGQMLAQQVDAHQDAVSCISFSPDGKTIASGGHDATVRVWSVAADGKNIRLLHHLRDRGRPEVMGVAFCMGGRLLASVTTTGTIRLRDPIRGEELRYIGVEGTVLTLACSADGRTLAAAGLGGRLCLCEVATGTLVLNKDERAAQTDGLMFTPTEGFPGEVRGLAVSATGLTIAAGTKSGDILLRDVGRSLTGRNPPAQLTDRVLEGLWKDLRESDAAPSYRAVAMFAARPESAIPFLAKQVTPIPRPDPAAVEKLLAQLDHPRFLIREKAAAELEKVIDTAEPILRQRLLKQPSLELRRRIERLVQPLDERLPPPDRLRASRALLALEQIGTAQARALLDQLARGCPGAWLTEEARQALDRLRVAEAR